MAEKKVEEATEEPKNTEVAVAGNTAIAVAEEMSFEDELLADAGAGQENIEMKHLTVPFFSILQQLSPQVQKGHAKYVKGAEAGMIMNTLTQECFKSSVQEENHNGIVVAAVKFEPKAIEWKPRGASGGGGGLVRVWGDDDSYTRSPDYQFSKEKNRWISKDGNEVTDHYDTYIVQIGYIDEKGEFVPQVGQGILSCKGSQIKKAKAWNTERNMFRIQVAGKSINPPAWYRTYKVQTRFESNDQGSWHGWEISPYEPIMKLDPTKAMYDLCKQMHAQLSAGELKADETARMAEAGSSDGGSLGGDIPF